jgi:hypothetical protein
VTIPAKLDAAAALTRIEGAAKRNAAAGAVSIDPAATSWTAYWES